MFDERAATSQLQLAGADRGRRGRQGRRRSRPPRRRLDGHRRDDEDRRTRRCRSTRTRELKIRPRIFLEGNFFVDLKPGTPDAPASSTTGDTIPIDPDRARRCSSTRCSARSRPTPARTSRSCSRATATRSAASRSRARTRDQDPATRGETAGAVAERLARGTRREALRGTAIVNEALLGTELHDLLEADRGPAARSPRRWPAARTQLKDLITNFNTTTAALAAEQDNLRATIRVLPRVLEAGQPGARQAQRRLPAAARVLARDPPRRPRDPGHDRRRRSRGSPRRASSCRSPSCRGLVNDLQPAVDDLAEFTDGTVQLPAAGRPRQPLRARTTCCPPATW